MAGDAWLRVCVFCGSNVGASESFVTIARELGAGLAARGLALVYGGGNVGLMGQLADAASPPVARPSA